MTRKFFYLEEAPYYANKYMIQMNHDLFNFPNGTRGSYRVMLARLVNLSYAQFLRYCRDVLGAELVGKNQKYVLPYFDKTNEVRMFVKLLNARMEYVMREQESPYEYTEGEDGKVIRTPFEELNDSNG